MPAANDLNKLSNKELMQHYAYALLQSRQYAQSLVDSTRVDINKAREKLDEWSRKSNELSNIILSRMTERSNNG